MRIDDIDIQEFSGKVTGARSATSEWPARAGMVLRVRTSDGLVGQGEASPLPGYSSDAYAPALAALRNVDWGSLPEPEALSDADELLERLDTVAGSTGARSARFALETAYLDLVGQRTARPLWQLLDGSTRAPVPVPVSSLIGSADDGRIVDSARTAVARGVAGVKVKLPGPSSDQRVERIRSVRAAIGNAGLRLDANGSLPVDRVQSELAKFRELDIEFIEEPVMSSVFDAVADPPVPIALDESLQSPNAWSRMEPVLTRLRCVALVLKPMALGGFSACVRWARTAREHGLHVTVSHLFDGPIALTACAHLALAIASRGYGSGLDPHGALRAWPTAALPLHSDSTVVASGRPGLGMAPLTGERP
jgi:L-alanine-DL-glutamate epimerase-like enolase superfamily enzyme